MGIFRRLVRNKIYYSGKKKKVKAFDHTQHQLFLKNKITPQSHCSFKIEFTLHKCDHLHSFLSVSD